MPRLRRYLDIDVLEAARQRFDHLYTVYDSVVVMFSGGKDSLVCLNLAREQADRRGRPVDVVFRDEELIPDSVIEFVDRYRQEPWVRMRWLAVPLINNKFVLGVYHDYIQWDPGRRWVRQKPEWAITQEDLGTGDTVFGQHTMDDLVARFYKGKLAYVVGMRADESLTRYRAVIGKEHENWITAQKGRVSLVKPIYDWTQKDVFLYLWEQGIPWCDLYESQGVAGGRLRVSTPLHAESSKRFSDLRAIDPDFYQRVIDVFPEMIPQERYWAQFDVEALVRRHTQNGFASIIQYVYDTMPDPVARARALTRIAEWRRKHARQPDSFPVDMLMRRMLTKTIERPLQGADIHARDRRKRAAKT